MFEQWRVPNPYDLSQREWYKRRTLQTLRKRNEDLERMFTEATQENFRLRHALHVIAKNTCCSGCQEAKQVAKNALNMGEA